MKICKEKHVLISELGNLLFLHPKAKLDLSWIISSEYAQAQKNIDSRQIKFCSEIEKLRFSDSEIGMYSINKLFKKI